MVLCNATPAQDEQPKKKTARRDNAAVLYELAISEARRAFDIPAGQMLDLPYEAAMASYRDEFWRKCTKNSAVARSLFEQASQLRHCRFEGLGSRRSQLDELGPVLIQLRTLVYAHAVQNINQRPGVALCDASCLLDHARQLSGVDSLQALALANVAEFSALQIARAVQDTPAISNHRDDQKRFAAKLEKHRQQRGTLRHLAAVVHDEVMNELPRFCRIDETNPYRRILAARVRKALEPVTNFAAHPKGSIATLEATKAQLKQEVRKNKLKTLKGNKQADLCVDRLLLPKIAHLASLLRKRNELTDLLEELR